MLTHGVSAAKMMCNSYFPFSSHISYCKIYTAIFLGCIIFFLASLKMCQKLSPFSANVNFFALPPLFPLRIFFFNNNLTTSLTLLNSTGKNFAQSIKKRKKNSVNQEYPWSFKIFCQSIGCKRRAQNFVFGVMGRGTEYENRLLASPLKMISKISITYPN